MQNIRRFSFHIVVALCALIVGFTLNPTPTHATTDGDISLFAITDLHGHLTQVTHKGTVTEIGAPVLACAINELRAASAHNAFVSVGDNIGGSAWISAASDDEPTVEVLNAMHLDVSATGNHEYDRGWRDLLSRIGGGVPVNEDGTPSTTAAVKAHVKPTFTYLVDNAVGADFTPYEIRTINGKKIAFIGAVTKNMDSLVSRSALTGIHFVDPAPVTNKLARTLKDTHRADAVIVLAHEDAQTIVKDLDGSVIDGLLAGHSHIAYINEHAPALNGTTIPTLEAASFGKLLGRMDLHFSTPDARPTIHVTNLGPEAIPQHCFTHPDEEVKKIVDNAQQAADKRGKRVVGHVGGTFMRGQSLNAHGTYTDRAAASTLSNMIADSMRAYGNDKPNPAHLPLVGVMNPGGVRADLFPADDGSVTYEQMLTIQPFGNQVGYQDLTGAQLKSLLSQQLQPSGSGRTFLKLGTSQNLTYTFNPAITDPAQRDAYIRTVFVDGKEITDQEYVRVYGNQFLLEGGDNFTAFTPETFHALGNTELDAFITYIRQDTRVPDYRPRAIGIEGPAHATPGEKISLSLSSLSYMGADTPATYRVHVTDGKTELASATLDNPRVGKEGETAQLLIDVTIPKNWEGNQKVHIEVAPEGNQTPQVFTFPIHIGSSHASVPEDGKDTNQATYQPQRAGQSGQPVVNHPGHLAATGVEEIWWILAALLILGSVGITASRIRH